MLGFGKGFDYSGLGIEEEIMPPWQVIFQLGYAFLPPLPQLPREGRILGTVLDKETDKPIAGAIVEFPGTRLTALYTDEEGTFYTYKFPKGHINIKVTKKGYVPTEEDKIKIKTGKIIEKIFYLKTAITSGKLVVKVYSSKKKPLKSILKFYDKDKNIVTTTETDKESGSTKVELEAGTYVIGVSSDGMLSKKVRVKVKKKKTYTIKIVLKPAEGNVKGVAVDKTSKAPLAARVTFSGKKSKFVSTDPISGNYKVRLESGKYNVKFEVRGYKGYSTVVTVNAGKTVTLNALMEKLVSAGTVQGRVLTADGKPIPAVVSFMGNSSDKTASDPNTGSYKISIQAGNYNVMAIANGFKPQTKQVTVELGKTAVLDFILEPAQQTGIVKGTVTTADKKKGVQAVITFPGEVIQNITTDPDSGSYVAKVPAKKLQIKASSSNYKPQIKDIEIKAGETKEVNFVLEPYKLIKITKKKIEIKQKIYFTTGKSIIKPQSFPILDEIAQVLNDSTKLRIRIEGHTDSQGSARYNQRLSQKRANAVMNYLISKGIVPSRLEAVGFGESRPIAPNDSEEGRAKNRRVEFVIVSHSIDIDK